MKVIVWGINYSPEMTGIAPFNTALCEFLAERGHQVEMVTSFAYYPEWKKRDEDRGHLFRTDRTNDVSIYRCWAFVPEKVSALRRIVHEASFVTFSLLRVLILRTPSIFVVVSPPLLLGVAAWCASVIKSAPFVFHIQDLQPDAAIALGMVRRGILTRLLYWIEKFAYARAVKVSAISNGIVARLNAKGVAAGNILLFPNGVRLPLDLPKRGEFRKRYHIADKAFLAVYSGNLGVKQGLDILVDAAKILQANNNGGAGHSAVQSIVIVIAGDGARRSMLAGAIARATLKNVLLLPLLPKCEYLEMLSDADCTVITQERDTGAFFFPSKLLSSVAAAKPVLSVADENSELAKAVHLGKLGRNVSPGCPELLAESLHVLAAESAPSGVNDIDIMKTAGSERSDKLSSMGRAGLEFAERFEMKRVLETFEQELLLIVDSDHDNRDDVGRPDTFADD